MDDQDGVEPSSVLGALHVEPADVLEALAVLCQPKQLTSEEAHEAKGEIVMVFFYYPPEERRGGYLGLGVTGSIPGAILPLVKISCCNTSSCQDMKTIA